MHVLSGQESGLGKNMGAFDCNVYSWSSSGLCVIMQFRRKLCIDVVSQSEIKLPSVSHCGMLLRWCSFPTFWPLSRRQWRTQGPDSFEQDLFTSQMTHTKSAAWWWWHMCEQLVRGHHLIIWSGGCRPKLQGTGWCIKAAWSSNDSEHDVISQRWTSSFLCFAICLLMTFLCLKTSCKLAQQLFCELLERRIVSVRINTYITDTFSWFMCTG